MGGRMVQVVRMRRLLALWRRHPFLSSAFVLGALLTAMFIARSVMFAIYWSDPAHRFQEIEPWMPARYVAYSWGLTPEEMAAALELESLPGRGRTMGEISAETGVPLPVLAERIAAAAQGREGAGK